MGLARVSARRRGAAREVLPTREDALGESGIDWAVSGESVFYADGARLRRVSDSPLQFNGRFCEPE